MIYFIQRGEDGPIKVGYSTDPVDRLKSLQTGNAERMRLIGFAPGTRAEEAALHRRLAPGRLEGEWFRPDTPGMEDVLEMAGHGEYLIYALGEAEEKANAWQKRRDELVEEILVHCSRLVTPKRQREAA